MKLKFRHKLSVWQYLALGYLLVIALGSVLLVLPVASKDGNTSYLDALFTATSATCVTGLVVFDTAVHWSLFGQIVILFLIQTGGLGFATFVTVLFMMFRRGSLGVSNKRTVMQLFGGDKYSGAGTLVLRVVIGTFIMETVGALLLSIRFIPDYGAGWGIFYSIFHAVSAFCNAGFDLLGSAGEEFASLSAYATDPLVILTVSFLILLGGLGFCIWGDVVDCKFRWKKMHFYTRFILVFTVGLLIATTLLFLLFERNNPCYSDYNFGEKLLCSFFNAVTPRTAGFSNSDYAKMSDSGYLLTLFLMFIGGCSGSTAGGIKLSTFAVIVLGMWAVLRGKRDINIGKRRVESSLLGQALAIFTAYLTIVILSTMVICAVEPPQEDLFRAVLFETVSALGTVGLSLGVTPTLTVASKLILILLMYMGRAGILTLSFAIAKKRTETDIRRPVVEIFYIG